MQNPYAELLSAMQRQGASLNPPGIRLAEVVSPPPDIVIKMGELQVDKNNILIADYMLPGYKREASGSSAGTIITHLDVEEPEPPDYSEHTVMESMSYEGTARFTDTLKSGDTVVVMPTEDRQTYIILARVVST